MTAIFWVGLILGVFGFLFVCNVLFDVFCWAFCVIDSELQELHWKKLRRQKKKEEEVRIKVFFEEMAA